MKKAGKDKSAVIFCLIAVSVIALDQLVKFFVGKTALGEKIFDTGFFSLTNLHNYGAGFSILQGYSWLFVAVALLMAALMIIFYDKIEKNILSQIGFALFLGGTLSNMFDRLRFGFVIDYLDFRIWPVFNIADSAITVGIAFIIIYYLFLEKKKTAKTKTDVSKNKK
jgi:signal peptidase II